MRRRRVHGRDTVAPQPLLPLLSLAPALALVLASPPYPHVIVLTYALRGLYVRVPPRGSAAHVTMPTCPLREISFA